MQIFIRPMVVEDIPALATLYEQFWNQKSDVNKMGQIFKQITQNPDYILLNAINEQKLVGSILGVICMELYGDCRPFIVVEDFIVDQHHKRKGIGAKLFRELENQAKQRGCGCVLLVTENNRQDAIGFYHAMGFEKDTFRGFKKKL